MHYFECVYERGREREREWSGVESGTTASIAFDYIGESDEND